MRRLRAGLPILALGAVLFFGLAVGDRDLWNPNEPLYGQAVVEMEAAGEWLIPTVNGEPFAEKPILYFWIALTSAKLFGGVDEWTLRLPSVLSGVAAVTLVYLLVLPYAGRRRGMTAALLLATTVNVFWSARQVQMDLMLAACVVGFLAAATRVLDHDRSPIGSWSLAGLAAGLGLLAKGPVALICAGLPLAAYVGWTRRWSALFTPAAFGGAAVAAIVAAPWYLMLLLRGETAFLNELLVRQNFVRFVDPWDHAAPWWYYLKYFWIDMAPWAFFVPLAAGYGKTDERERRLHLLCWIWLLVIVAFFSLSASKRSPYILPVAPPVAILVSGPALRWWDRKLGAGPRALALALVATVASGLLLGAYLARFDLRLQEIGTTIGRSLDQLALLLLVGGLLLFASLIPSWRQRFAAPCALLGVLAATYLISAMAFLPVADRFKSHRPFCELVRERVAEDRPLRGFHEWKWRASYSYYTGRAVPNLADDTELQAYWGRDDEVFLIVERGRLEALRGVLGPVHPIESRAVGSNEVHLFSNRQDLPGAQPAPVE